MSFTNEVELLSKKHVSENMFSGWGLSGFRCIEQQGDFSTPVLVVCYHSANPALKHPLSRDNVKQTLLCMTRPCLVKSWIAFHHINWQPLDMCKGNQLRYPLDRVFQSG